jgi:flavin-binding protein dodecin
MVTDSMMDRVDRFEIDLEKVLATIATNHWQIIVKATFKIATNSDLN